MRALGFALAILLCSFSCTSVQYVNQIGNLGGSEFATIYVISPPTGNNGIRRVTYEIDELEVGRMGFNSYLKTEVACNEAKEVTMKASMGGPGSSFNYEITPNTVHYFEVDYPRAEALFGRPFLRKLSTKEGEVLLAQVDKPAKLKPAK